jgi:plasmid stabilization system protein ParE
MPALYRLAIQAECDLDAIIDYIAKDNVTAAKMMLDRFYEAFQLVADNPGIGHQRRDLTDRDVRFWTVKPRFHVIYSANHQPLLIARVLPADRDIALLLVTG